MTFTIDRCRDLLREHFGFPAFRGGQEQVLTGLQERDALAVMPTGSGKSMCYILPALDAGRTLVVSPLIALMQDQVDSLRAAGARAGFINSTITREAQNQAYLDFVRGDLRLLYVAPERFRNERFVEGLRAAGINLLAIDEAHCMSEWGHDFRPDYLLLGAVRERLGSPRTLALTATADPRVQEDITRTLRLDESSTRVVTSVDRPNLRLNALEATSPSQKSAWLERYVRSHPGESGIVYVRTRAAVEETVDALTAAGLSAAGYHAGMPDDVRASVQRRFMRDEVPVVVATNAFGLGVDKADVRFVVHLNMPGRLESYYQEAGRAGRDGDPAECTLLYNARDEQAQRFFIDRAHPADEDVREVWHGLMAGAAGVRSETDGYAAAFNALRHSGLIDELGRPLFSDAEAAIDTGPIALHRRYIEERLARMVEYATSNRCRRRVVLEYFGEAAPERCGNCDNCLSGAVESADPSQDLMDALFELRDRLAARLRREPVALLDSHTIRDLAAHRPRDREELVQTRGIADVKADWFGPEVLRCIAEWEAAHPDAPERTARRPKPGARALPGMDGEQLEVVDRELYEQLAAWRLDRARRDGVPAYVVASNRTLRELAATHPADEEALASVWGFGAARVERYGDEVLAVVGMR